MKHEKKYGKRANRPERTARTLTAAERTAASPLPREMSAKILGNPKNKLTAKNRKRLMRSRDFSVLHPSVKLAKPVKDQIKEQVACWTMGQLVRKTVQCPDQIRLAKGILDDLSPDSSFAPGIRRAIAVNSLVLSVVKAEIAKRTKSPAVRDTRTPRVRKWDGLKAALSQLKG